MFLLLPKANTVGCVGSSYNWFDRWNVGRGKQKQLLWNLLKLKVHARLCNTNEHQATGISDVSCLIVAEWSTYGRAHFNATCAAIAQCLGNLINRGDCDATRYARAGEKTHHLDRLRERVTTALHRLGSRGLFLRGDIWMALWRCRGVDAWPAIREKRTRWPDSRSATETSKQYCARRRTTV